MMGRFNKSTGKFSIDPAAKTAALEVVIDAASVSIGVSEKGGRPRSHDERLRASNFLKAADFPRTTFESTNVAFHGDQPARVEGKLTLPGVAKPVTLTIERFKCAEHPIYKKAACGGNASGACKRTNFGLKTFVPSLGDEIGLSSSFLAFND